MEYVTIITVLALLQYVWFGIQVGSLRAKHEVKAPAMSGPPEFERMFRVHYNTMEQLVLFLPALWIHAQYANPLWGAVLGGVFIVGRFLYRAEYLKDPGSRSPGFTITITASLVLMIWALVAAIKELL